jgi:multisubunit Na+/H+ antiporter MnhC subunit
VIEKLSRSLTYSIKLMSLINVVLFLLISGLMLAFNHRGTEIVLSLMLVASAFSNLIIIMGEPKKHG